MSELLNQLASLSPAKRALLQRLIHTDLIWTFMCHSVNNLDTCLLQGLRVYGSTGLNCAIEIFVM